MSSTAILVLIFLAIIALCSVSLVVYFMHRRKLALEESMKLTETEERFLEVLQLKKKIRKAEKNKEDPTLLRSLKSQLKDLRTRQVSEYVSLLEHVDPSESSSSNFDI